MRWVHLVFVFAEIRDTLLHVRGRPDYSQTKYSVDFIRSIWLKIPYRYIAGDDGLFMS